MKDLLLFAWPRVISLPTQLACYTCNGYSLGMGGLEWLGGTFRYISHFRNVEHMLYTIDIYRQQFRFHSLPRRHLRKYNKSRGIYRF